MSIKVCHLSSVHPRTDIRIFEKECVSLVLAGYTVYFIVNDQKPDELNKGVHIVSTGFKALSRQQRMRLGPKAIYHKALEIDAQVYHIHDPELLSIAHKLVKRGKQVIYDAHEDVPRQILSKLYIPLFLRKTISYFFEIYENAKVKHLSAVITPTPHIQERFIQIHQQTVMVCNYPILSEFSQNNQQVFKKEYICYVGALTRTRGLYEMAEAVKSLPLKLILAGKFESEAIQLDILSKYPNIDYRGYLNRTEIVDILDRSAIGLLILHNYPNTVNSYPIKLFEYMAAKVPVIASDFPLWRTIIDQAKCGICVNPDSLEDIRKAIDYILQNPQEAKAMGENGKEAVKNIYNWKSQEQALCNLYHQLLSKGTL
ncbi:MAG: glycosyltransferase family 4 protein [Erysipelotrichaceae bacterium]